MESHMLALPACSLWGKNEREGDETPGGEIIFRTAGGGIKETNTL